MKLAMKLGYYDVIFMVMFNFSQIGFCAFKMKAVPCILTSIEFTYNIRLQFTK